MSGEGGKEDGGWMAVTSISRDAYNGWMAVSLIIASGESII